MLSARVKDATVLLFSSINYRVKSFSITTARRVLRWRMEERTSILMVAAIY